MTDKRPAPVSFTDAEAVAVLVALDLYANEIMEGAGMKSAAITRATRKIERAREGGDD